MKGRPGLALAAALVTLAPLTAACGAGLNAETLREGTTIDGANAQTADLRIRNAFLAAPKKGIEFPAGSDIDIHVTLNNIGSRPDTLTEATSPLGQIILLPDSGASESPSAAASASVPTESRPVELPGFAAVTLGGQEGRMVLRQVPKAVRVASFVPITLRFASADEVTIKAPVGSGYGPGAGPTPTEKPTTSGEGNTSEESTPAGEPTGEATTTREPTAPAEPTNTP